VRGLKPESPNHAFYAFRERMSRRNGSAGIVVRLLIGLSLAIPIYAQRIITTFAGTSSTPPVAELAIPEVEARGVPFAQCEIGEFISDRSLPPNIVRDAVSFLQAP
jgi:hypothetical protein